MRTEVLHEQKGNAWIIGLYGYMAVALIIFLWQAIMFYFVPSPPMIVSVLGPNVHVTFWIANFFSSLFWPFSLIIWLRGGM